MTDRETLAKAIYDELGNLTTILIFPSTLPAEPIDPDPGRKAREEAIIRLIESDTANSAVHLVEIFSQRYAENIRFDAKRKRWVTRMFFDWKTEETLLVEDRIRKVCRDAAAGVKNEHLKRKLSSLATMRAVERMARRDSRLALAKD